MLPCYVFYLCIVPVLSISCLCNVLQYIVPVFCATVFVLCIVSVLSISCLCNVLLCIVPVFCANMPVLCILSVLSIVSLYCVAVYWAFVLLYRVCAVYCVCVEYILSL